MNALRNAGQSSNSRYVDLTYLVAENEEEEEQRDYSRVSKTTQPVLQHSSFAAIGSSNCLKQKNIRKLFPQTLKQCEELDKANKIPVKKPQNGENGLDGPHTHNQSFVSLQSKINNPVGNSLASSRINQNSAEQLPETSPFRSTTMLRKSGLAGEIEDKVTADFMKLMDYMQGQKSTRVNDKLFRENYRKKSL